MRSLKPNTYYVTFFSPVRYFGIRYFKCLIPDLQRQVSCMRSVGTENRQDYFLFINEYFFTFTCHIAFPLCERGMKGDLFLDDSVLNLTKVILEGIFLDIFKDQINEKFCTVSEAYTPTCVVVCRFCRKIQIETADFTSGKK